MGRVSRLAGIALLLSAQLAPAQVLTLQAAMDQAQQHSPSVRAADAGVRAAERAIDVARQRPNPNLTLEAENIFGSGPYHRFDALESTAAIELPLELGGKRAARVGVAQAERAAEAVAATAARAELVLQVTLAFIEAVASERRAAATAESLQWADQSLRAAELRVRAGKNSPIDAQRARVQQINASIAAEHARRMQTLAQANLARLTGMPLPLELAAPWFDASVRPIDPPSGATILELAASDARVAAASARVSAAQRARTPDLALSLGVRRFAVGGDTAAVLGLSIPLPIFNAGGAELARSGAELERAQAERAAVLQEIEQRIASAQAEVVDAQATAAAAEGPALAAASEAARIARIGYAEGKFSQLDLIDAERSLAETRQAAIDALASYHGARARLDRLQGRVNPIEQD